MSARENDIRATIQADPQSKSALLAAADNWQEAAENYRAHGRGLLAEHAQRQADSFREQARHAR